MFEQNRSRTFESDSRKMLGKDRRRTFEKDSRRILTRQKGTIEKDSRRTFVKDIGKKKLGKTVAGCLRRPVEGSLDRTTHLEG